MYSNYIYSIILILTSISDFFERTRLYKISFILLYKQLLINKYIFPLYYKNRTLLVYSKLFQDRNFYLDSLVARDSRRDYLFILTTLIR